MLPPALRGTAAPPPLAAGLQDPAQAVQFTFLIPVRQKIFRKIDNAVKLIGLCKLIQQLPAFQRHRLEPGVRRHLPFCAGSQHMIIRECRLDPLLRQERCKTCE